MNGYGRCRRDFSYYVLINRFGYKRNKGSGNADKFSQRRIQRHIRRFFVLVHALAPEAFATAAHIPVGQLVGKFGDGARTFGNFIVVKLHVHVFDQRVYGA